MFAYFVIGEQRNEILHGFGVGRRVSGGGFPAASCRYSDGPLKLSLVPVRYHLESLQSGTALSTDSEDYYSTSPYHVVARRMVAGRVRLSLQKVDARHFTMLHATRQKIALRLPDWGMISIAYGEDEQDYCGLALGDNSLSIAELLSGRMISEQLSGARATTISIFGLPYCQPSDDARTPSATPFASGHATDALAARTKNQKILLSIGIILPERHL
ncbi:hypothetical protein PMIN01_06990 [Paraphaeosphaeria minitans]|uniref:Uncharacterized protein n=1 Tax=Paraphaeosphaeria minitans TaxID=565426 RepID=A0A9P6GIG5_9PLEO|nr:hypothetical protein PMIN01_06990 [Paraphaeosphaeria minitans]